LSGWLLMLALVYAPWALGCVKPWATVGLAAITILSGGLWALACMMGGRRPRVLRVCGWSAGLLLIQGWWMVFNARGADEAATERAMMQQISAVLAAFVVGCDLAARKTWRWRLLVTIGVTGVSIAAYGLLEKAGLVPALAHRNYQESVFATYDYHGNAGAYLNLAIPAVFALAMTRKREGVAGLLVCMAGAMANVSRAAAAISLGLIAGLGLWIKAQRRRLIISLIVAAVLATIAGGGAAWRRWGQLASMVNRNNPRLLMLRLAVPMAREAGFFGYGPGSFKLIYPTSPHLPPELYERWQVLPYQVGQEPSIYSYVHNDYLQYVIEWGWVGGLLWAMLVGGAVKAGIQAYRNADGREQLILVTSLAALSGVFAHALVDWPLQVASLQLYAAIYLALLASSPNRTCASC
jgi:O-antigen ligase